MLLPRLAQTLLVATLVLVAWGGTVTSTNSGLACGDHWPACFEVRRAEAGEQVRPTLMPRMEGGVFIEHGHRALAATIGLGAIALVILAYRRRPLDRGLRRASVAALALVVAQGLLGALTVRLRLPAAVTTSHLAFSMAFTASLVLLVARSRPAVAAGQPRPSPAVPPRVRGWALAAVGLVFVQLVLGGIVRHTGSAPVCTAQFPLCNGQWLPVSLEQWIHVIHRTMAFVVAGIVVLASVLALRARPRARSAAIGAIVLVGVQLGLGIITVLTGIRPVWATAHLLGGALLFVDVLAMSLALGAAAARAPARSPAAFEPRAAPQGAHA